MTRERIKDFKEIILPFFTNYLLKENYENLGKSDAEEFEKDFNEILNLAAKALETKPCEDAISRQEVLRIIGCQHGMMPNDIHHTIWKELKSLSPVQPKPKTKTGYWIKHPQGSQCSVCKTYSINHFNDNYCPNCGVKMIEPQESEDKCGR